jgi:inner membrane transporter RhtA
MSPLFVIRERYVHHPDVDANSSVALTGPVATSTVPLSRARVGALMAVCSMLTVQVGLGAAVGLIGDLGAEGTAWLRLIWAGAIFLVLGRPWRLHLTRPALASGVVLGVATAGVTLLFMGAIARLPLGMASALEFLGPLGVAVTRGSGRGRLRWPALAATGVVLLTEPWTGTADPVGVALALGAALCWATYIVFTQRVGDQVAGVGGLAVSMPVAAVVATVVAGPETLGRMTPHLWLVGLGLALMLPVIPFTLELLALRRLNTAAFGTLMSLEPGFALLVGLVLLGQVPTLLAVLGIGFVVAAGIGAERSGARDDPPVATLPECPPVTTST